MIRVNNPDRIPGYVMPQNSLSVIEYGLNDVLQRVPEQDRGKAEKYLQSFMDSHQTLNHHASVTIGLWACDSDPDTLEQKFIDHGGTLADFFKDVLFQIKL